MLCCRHLWEKETLDTSCPQLTSRTSVVKHRPRPSDDVFREVTEHAKNNRKDSGSHSGSDSGMGFSETASEHNLPAVLPSENDVTTGVMTDDVTSKRCSQVLDPRMYLEASYNQDHRDQKLNPSDYLNQSTVVTEQPTTTIHGNPKVYQSKSTSSQDHPSKPSTSKDHPSKSLKKHYWEILEEPTSNPQSPEGIQYAPSPQTRVTRTGQKRSNFRDTKHLASIMPMEESVNDDLNIPIHNSNPPIEDPGVTGEETGDDDTSKQRTQSKRRNELDDLFDTLDFVSEALAPPRVVYDDKATVDEHKPKKSRNAAKSTEASRRREEYTRSKLQQGSREESPLRSKRTTRSQAKERPLARGTLAGNDGPHGTPRDQHDKPRDTRTRTRRQQSEIDEKPLSDTTRSRQRRNHTPDQSTNEPLRRSRRIAESSNCKAVLVLDTSGYPEESSTDLNQAFVDSTLSESKHEAITGSVDHDKSTARKKKVRRQSSVVKTNKSRARNKRTGYKSRKDRSIDT